MTALIENAFTRLRSETLRITTPQKLRYLKLMAAGKILFVYSFCYIVLILICLLHSPKIINKYVLLSFSFAICDQVYFFNETIANKIREHTKVYIHSEITSKTRI